MEFDKETRESDIVELFEGLNKPFATFIEEIDLTEMPISVKSVTNLTKKAEEKILRDQKALDVELKKEESENSIGRF